jgi:exodeoxyribonuclease VIII
MIHKALSFEDYRKIYALNQSKLGALKTCPAKFKYLLENEREDNEAFRLGRAIHAAVLEPDSFNAQFLALPPDLDRRTTKGKELYAALLADNADKTILKADEFNRALEIASSVRSNVHANQLLDGAHVELSCDWVDPGTEVKCKARIDAYNEGMAVVVDIKTTTDASRSGFPRKLFSYGYHRQAAWYLDALHAHGEAAKHFVFIAVEKEPPYCVGLYRLTDETLKLSRAENDALLRRYAECLSTDTWPGYTTGIEDISLPDYATQDMTEEYGIIESI